MCPWGGGGYNWTLEKNFSEQATYIKILIKILFEDTHISTQVGGGEADNQCILGLQVHGPMTGGGLISREGGGGLKSSMVC